MTTNGHLLAKQNGYPNPELNEGHTCTECGAPVGCEYKALTHLRVIAKALTTLANHREGQLVGIKWGRPRNHEFTAEQASHLLAQHKTIAGVARALGVDWRTVRRELSVAQKNRRQG